MKLLIALILSLFIHAVVLIAIIKTNNIVTEKNDSVTIETVKFDLGIVTGLSESLLEKKINSEEQVQAKANVLATAQAKSTQQKAEIKKAVNKKEISELDKVIAENLINKVTAEKQEKITTSKIENKLQQETFNKTNKDELRQSKTKVIPSPTSEAADIASIDAKLQIKQNTKDVSNESLGGRALSTESENVEAASYIAALQRKIANSANRLYPKKSKRNNEEGVIKVGFYLTSNGVIERVSVIEGSQFPALNKAAIKAVKRLKKYKPLPKGLKNYFVIPISFKLR